MAFAALMFILFGILLLVSAAENTSLFDTLKKWSGIG